jgi:hypothetical protein
MRLTIDKQQVSTAKRIVPRFGPGRPSGGGTTIGVGTLAGPRNPLRPAARRARCHSADRPAQPPRRATRRRRRRDFETPRPRGYGRKHAQSARYLEARSLAVNGAPRPGRRPRVCRLNSWRIMSGARPALHGVPADVASALRVDAFLSVQGPHASATVTSTADELVDPASMVRHRRGVRLPRPAVRLAPRRQRFRPARDILDRLSATCASDRLAGARDLTILMVAFASGGRRRSEVARHRFG